MFEILEHLPLHDLMLTKVHCYSFFRHGFLLLFKYQLNSPQYAATLVSSIHLTTVADQISKMSLIGCNNW